MDEVSPYLVENFEILMAELAGRTDPAWAEASRSESVEQGC